MTTCRARSSPSDDPCDISNSCFPGPSYSFDPDLRAKSTPPYNHHRQVLPYPSPPLTDGGLASTVPLPDVQDSPGHPPIDRPYSSDFSDENMSHDAARHIAPPSPPPTGLIGLKELPSEDELGEGSHQVESWRYGEGVEDASAPAPLFPPVRDDSGYEEFNVDGGCEDDQKLAGSHGGAVLIEPTSVWSPHSPLSIDEGLPLVDLPSLDGVLSRPGFSRGSGHDDILVSPITSSDGDSHTDSWMSGSDMEWSPSSTFAGELSTPSSPDLKTATPLGFYHHHFPYHPPASLDEIPYDHHDAHWFNGHSYGTPQPTPLTEDHSPFIPSLHQFPLHLSTADIDSEYSDTVMPPEDDDDATLLPPSSPRRRPLNDLHDAILPHGDVCPTPIPRSPRSPSLSLREYEMDEVTEDPGSPHSPHCALPELEDEEMPVPPEEANASAVDTISPSLLGGAPEQHQAGLGLFLQPLSDLPLLARSPSPDEDDFGFLDVQMDPEAVNVEVDEFLQLRTLRKNALTQERAARMAEADLNERITALASTLLPPTQAESVSELDADVDQDVAMHVDLDPAEKRLRKRELHSMMDMRTEARRTRKLQKQRSKEIGALLDFRMHEPVSPMALEGFPPFASGKGWTRSIAHLVAHMIMRRRDRARPLDNKAAAPQPAVPMRRASYLRRSVSASDLDLLAAELDGDGEDDDMEM